MSDHEWMTGDDEQKEKTKTIAKVAAGASFLPACIVIGICCYALACKIGWATEYCTNVAEGAENTPLVQPSGLAAATYQQQPQVMQAIAGLPQPIAGLPQNVYP